VVINKSTIPVICCHTTLWNITVRKQAINDKLQGSVATYLRCGGVVNNQNKKGLFLSLQWKKLKSVNVWQSYKQERGWFVHFVLLATTLLVDVDSARDIHVLACNFVDPNRLDPGWSLIPYGCDYCHFSSAFDCLQCFDTVGWAAGRASGLLKTEWWGAGVVICLERGAALPLPLTVSCFSKIQIGFYLSGTGPPG